VDLLIDYAPNLLPYLHDSRAQEVIGRAYSVSTDRCAEAVVSGSIERFSELFEEAFNLGLFLYGRVPLKDVDLRERDQARVGTQPVIDMMSLSGLALIRDELDGPGFWEPVRDHWNDFLSDDRRSPRKLMEIFLVIGDGAVTDFGVPPRFTIRTGWRQKMAQALRERGVPVGRRNRRNISTGPRSLLNAALSGSSSIRDPIHVFLSVLVAMRPESIGLDWPREIRSCIRQWTGKQY